MSAASFSPALDPRPRRRALRAVPLATATIAFVAYAASAARTITWWDGSQYPLAAVTLGITGSPGSLLLTLLGWVVSRIPIVHPGAPAQPLPPRCRRRPRSRARRAATPREPSPGRGAERALRVCVRLGVTGRAGPFTPYGLSALWALIRWRLWRGGVPSSFFLRCPAARLDFSVHRTNALLVPAALVWILIRSPASTDRLRDGAVAIAGMALGLAFHLLLIPMAARLPSYMAEDPGSWAGFWSYVSMERVGGGFLVNLFPRRAPFFSAQVADYFSFLARNLGTALFLPAILAAWGPILRHHPAGSDCCSSCAGPGRSSISTAAALRAG
jgi:hypothetical protein